MWWITRKDEEFEFLRTSERHVKKNGCTKYQPIFINELCVLDTAGSRQARACLLRTFPNLAFRLHWSNVRYISVQSHEMLISGLNKVHISLKKLEVLGIWASCTQFLRTCSGSSKKLLLQNRTDIPALLWFSTSLHVQQKPRYESFFFFLIYVASLSSNYFIKTQVKVRSNSPHVWPLGPFSQIRTLTGCFSLVNVLVSIMKCETEHVET